VAYLERVRARASRHKHFAAEKGGKGNLASKPSGLAIQLSPGGGGKINCAEGKDRPLSRKKATSSGARRWRARTSAYCHRTKKGKRLGPLLPEETLNLARAQRRGGDLNIRAGKRGEKGGGIACNNKSNSVDEENPLQDGEGRKGLFRT